MVLCMAAEIERDLISQRTKEALARRKAEGKPLFFLVNANDRAKVKLDGSSVALMPEGWDWDIVPVKFTDLWSCGCHTIRKN